MAITISDPALANALRESKEDVEVKDSAGKVLGVFVTGGMYLPPPGYKPKITDAEMQRRLNDKTPGRALKDILLDVEARG